MKLKGITLNKLKELGIELKDTLIERINNEHSRNDTTISNESLFSKNYGVMRDVVFGNLYFHRINTQETKKYVLFINSNKIDFIDDYYALEKLVEVSKSAVLIKVTDEEIIPWLIQK